MARPACLRYRAHVARSPLPRECPSSGKYRHRCGSIRSETLPAPSPRPDIRRCQGSSPFRAPGVARRGPDRLTATGPRWRAPWRYRSRERTSVSSNSVREPSSASQKPQRGESSGRGLGHRHHPHAGRLGRDGAVEGVLDGQAAGRVDTQLGRRGQVGAGVGLAQWLPLGRVPGRHRVGRCRAGEGGLDDHGVGARAHRHREGQAPRTGPRPRARRASGRPPLDDELGHPGGDGPLHLGRGHALPRVAVPPVPHGVVDPQTHGLAHVGLGQVEPERCRRPRSRPGARDGSESMSRPSRSKMTAPMAPARRGRRPTGTPVLSRASGRRRPWPRRPRSG